MKRFTDALPAGLSPEPTQISGPPRSESVSAPAPGVCAHCRDHHPRIPKRAGGWEHFRASERGVESLGMCSTPPVLEPKSEAPQRRPLTHEEALAILREKAARGSASRVLAEARETFATHSEPSEEDDDETP